MIINIKGTSGTGKSTLVRRLVGIHYRRFTRDWMPGDIPGKPIFILNRKQPIAYAIRKYPESDYPSHSPLYVIGHYETPCGGADTIQKQDEVFERAARYADRGDVIFEGLLSSADVVRTAKLAEDHDVRVFILDTPLDQCVANVEKRRRERGNFKKLNPKNTASKYKGCRRCGVRLEEEFGVPVMLASFDQCLKEIRRLLNV